MGLVDSRVCAPPWRVVESVARLAVVVVAAGACAPLASGRPAPEVSVRAEPGASTQVPRAGRAAPRPIVKTDVDRWLEDLRDPIKRHRVIMLLEQKVEDTVTKVNGEMDAPELRELLDRVVEPLTRAYVAYYGELDDRSRVHIVKLLADFRDARAEPALRKAFVEFARNPSGDRAAQDIKWAVRAAGELKLPGLSPAVLAAFEKLQAHTLLGGITFKDYSRAMVEIADPAWSDALIALLAVEIDPPRTRSDEHKIDPYRDQLFWQTTSAQVLGRIEDPQAVEPLLKVLLDPDKAELATTALMALVRIGEPAVAQAGKLLSGADAALAGYARARMQKATGSKVAALSHVEIASAVLGTAGLSSGLPPLIRTMKGKAVPSARAYAALELTKIPATDASKAEYRAFVDGLAPGVLVQGDPALARLFEASAGFYDPTLVDWLLARARRASGDKEQVHLARLEALTASLKLAQPAQLGGVRAAVHRFGTQVEKERLAIVERMLKACDRDVACYLEEISKPDNQGHDDFAGIKAGWMIGILGDAAARDRLVAGLDQVESPALRFAAAQAIDHLTPNGSADVIRELERIVAEHEKSADRDRIYGDAPLQQVAFRLRARTRR